MHLNKNKVGMVLGTLVGGLHVVWSVLVAFGWAQPLVNLILKLHMIRPTLLIVDAFDFGTAIALVLVTSIVGYVVGYAFASIWNYLHK
jgi:hypothetical protein